MARDDMSTHPVSDPKRSLEIHSAPRPEAGEVCPGKRFVGRINGKTTVSRGNYSKTYAVYGHALSQIQFPGINLPNPDS